MGFATETPRHREALRLESLPIAMIGAIHGDTFSGIMVSRKVVENLK